MLARGIPYYKMPVVKLKEKEAKELMQRYARAERSRPLRKKEKESYTELRKLYWLHRGFYVHGFGNSVL